jgi:curved DNA-binding protein CbpA
MLGLVQRLDSVAATVQPKQDESNELERRLDEMLRRSESGDLYGILSVSGGASEHQIKEAYHALAKQYHPDRFQSKDCGAEIRTMAEKLFARITGAYATLGDPTLRSTYDKDCQKKGGPAEFSLKDQSVADRENRAEAIFHAGQGFFAKGEFEKAAERLRECVWLKPDVAKYQYLLGASNAELPKLRKEAEQCLLKAVELDRTLSDAYLSLGKLYLRSGLARRAEAQLREVLRLSPNHTEAGMLLREIVSGDRPSR